MKKYTETHEWVLFDPETNQARVGITNEAQKQLGEIVFVSLPLPDQQIPAGEEAVIVESSKAATGIASPVSGKVTEVNAALENTPSLINSSPEENGWLFTLSVDRPSELTSLFDEKEYRG